MSKVPHLSVAIVAILFIGASETEEKTNIKPGDTVVVSEDGTKLMLGNESLGELPKGTKLEVVRLQGEWIGADVTLEGNKQTGWVKNTEAKKISEIERQVCALLMNTRRAPGALVNKKGFFQMATMVQNPTKPSVLRSTYGIPQIIEPEQTLLSVDGSGKEHHGELWFYGRVGVLVDNDRTPMLLIRIPLHADGEEALRKAMATAIDLLPNADAGKTPAGKEPATGKCERCGQEALGTEEFYARCEQAGLVVDRHTGEVKARLGGFTMMGSMLDASAKIDGQRTTQREILEDIENRRGFRCTSCGRLYCMECLFNHAPSHPDGGKACPKCGGTFEVLDYSSGSRPWEKDWTNFMAKVLEYFQSEAATDELEKAFAGRQVTWEGKIKELSLESDRPTVTLAMPAVSLVTAADESVTVDELTLLPEPENVAGWKGLKPGTRVRFTTTLKGDEVGTLKLPVVSFFQGLSGRKSVVKILTHDAELTEVLPEEAQVGESEAAREVGDIRPSDRAAQVLEIFGACTVLQATLGRASESPALLDEFVRCREEKAILVRQIVPRLATVHEGSSPLMFRLKEDAGLDWKQVVHKIGPAEAHREDKATFTEQAPFGPTFVHIDVTWHRYDWLEIGVQDDGSIPVLRVDCARYREAHTPNREEPAAPAESTPVADNGEVPPDESATPDVPFLISLKAPEQITTSFMAGASVVFLGALKCDLNPRVRLSEPRKVAIRCGCLLRESGVWRYCTVDWGTLVTESQEIPPAVAAFEGVQLKGKGTMHVFLIDPAESEKGDATPLSNTLKTEVAFPE
jgi:hypothetical protein